MNNLLSIRRRHKSFFFPNRMTRIKIWRTSRCLWSASLLPRPWAATITTKPCDNPVIYFQSSFALIQTRADRWDLKRNGNALKWYNDMNRLQPTDSTWSQRASVSYYYSNVICDLNVSWFIQIIQPTFNMYFNQWGHFGTWFFVLFFPLTALVFAQKVHFNPTRTLNLVTISWKTEGNH